MIDGQVQGLVQALLAGDLVAVVGLLDRMAAIQDDWRRHSLYKAVGRLYRRWQDAQEEAMANGSTGAAMQDARNSIRRAWNIFRTEITELFWPECAGSIGAALRKLAEATKDEETGKYD